MTIIEFLIIILVSIILSIIILEGSWIMFKIGGYFTDKEYNKKGKK